GLELAVADTPSKERPDVARRVDRGLGAATVLGDLLANVVAHPRSEVVELLAQRAQEPPGALVRARHRVLSLPASIGRSTAHRCGRADTRKLPCGVQHRLDDRSVAFANHETGSLRAASGDRA